ncbi:MAG: Cas10/Cmr2 second palm domain-containing protein [Myxococcota bacterium]
MVGPRARVRGEDVSRWLVAITLGPLVEFIGAGRRSRDLWFGSQYASDRVAHACRELLKSGSPAPGHNVTLLQPRPERLDVVADTNLLNYRARLPNKVLALVESESAEALSDQLRRVLEKVREGFAGLVEQNLKVDDVAQLLDQDALDRQLSAMRCGDFLELYAAWVPVADALPTAEDRRRVWTLIQARKGARLFTAADFSRPGRPKSDLDPGRDTILRDPAGEPRRGMGERLNRLRVRAGVRQGEQLDAIGLARRLAVFSGTSDVKLPRLPFAPLSRVTADPWLWGAARKAAGERALSVVRSELGTASNGDQDTRDAFFAISSPARDDWAEQRVMDLGLPSSPGFEFGYDASVLFEGGLEAARQAYCGRRIREVQDLLRRLRRPVDRLHEVHGTPEPYYALLTFDGDGVGSALDALDHDGFVRAQRCLDRFADETVKLLGSAWIRGCPFYVGGDEGMAYIPLDRLPFAMAMLGRTFEDLVTRDSVWREATTDAALSLSVGAVIAHVKYDLRAVRAQAAVALSEAKRARREANSGQAWAEIREMPRGGAPRHARDPLEKLAPRLVTWMDLLGRDAAGMSLAQGLMELSGRLGDSEAPASGTVGLELARAMLRDKAKRSGRELPEPLLELARPGGFRNWEHVTLVATELLIAHRIRRSNAQADGRFREADRRALVRGGEDPSGEPGREVRA